MSQTSRVGSMEVGQDLAHQRRVWIFERVGWAVIFLIITAAILGLAGPGPLSKKQLKHGNLEVRLNSLERNHARAKLQFKVGAALVKDGKIRLTLSNDYLEKIQVDRMEPEPESVEAGASEQAYSFAAMENQHPVAITVHFRPNGIGRLEGRVAVGPETLEIKQFIFP